LPTVAQTPATIELPNSNTSEVTIFGLGVVQQIDAAAMEIYLGWRRFEVDELTTDGANGVTLQPGGVRDIDLVHGGARIRF
jgi:hypothetical protein